MANTRQKKSGNMPAQDIKATTFHAHGRCLLPLGHQLQQKYHDVTNVLSDWVKLSYGQHKHITIHLTWTLDQEINYLLLNHDSSISEQLSWKWHHASCSRTYKHTGIFPDFFCRGICCAGVNLCGLSLFVTFWVGILFTLSFKWYSVDLWPKIYAWFPCIWSIKTLPYPPPKKKKKRKQLTVDFTWYSQS